MQCAIYARYSSEEQTGSSTIESQIRESSTYIAGKGWELIPNMIFVDEAKSGTSTANRDGFNRMMELVKSPDCPFNAIVVWSRSRLYRDVADAAIYERMLERQGVNTVSVSDPNVGNTPDGFLIKWVLDGTNAYFIKRLAVETKRGQKQNVIEGGFSTGGKCAFGYKPEAIPDPLGRVDRSGQPKRKVRWIVDEMTAPTVRRIFQLSTEGNGVKAIARTLNTEGCPAQKATGWDSSTVWYILQNETYLGRRIYGKSRKVKMENGKRSFRYNPRSEWVIKENAHESIISLELWDKAQARKRHIRPAGETSLGKMRAAYTKYLLSGVMTCGDCGARLVGSANGTEGHVYYRCGWNNRRGPAICKNSSRINVRKVEQALLDAIYGKVITPETVGYLVDKVNELLNESKDSVGAKARQLESQLHKIDNEIANIIRAIQDGGSTFPELKEAYARCRENKEKIESQLAQLVDVREQEPVRIDRQAVEKYLSGLRETLLQGPVLNVREAIKKHVAALKAYHDGGVLLQPAVGGVLGELSPHWLKLQHTLPAYYSCQNFRISG